MVASSLIPDDRTRKLKSELQAQQGGCARNRRGWIYARKFAAYLTENADSPEISHSPQAQRLVTEHGRQFFDS